MLMAVGKAVAAVSLVSVLAGCRVGAPPAVGSEHMTRAVPAGNLCGRELIDGCDGIEALYEEKVLQMGHDVPGLEELPNSCVFEGIPAS